MNKEGRCPLKDICKETSISKQTLNSAIRKLEGEDIIYLEQTGGSAIVALTFGMGDSKRANQYFSLFVYVVAGLGVFFAILGIVLIRPIAVLLGAEGDMLKNAVLVILLPQEYKLAGAAVATALSQIVGGTVPLVYMSNISMSLVGMLYNVQLLKYAGEDGIAAYGVMMYVSMSFSAAFPGYSIGTAPVIGYHDGAKNHSELKGLLSIFALSFLFMGFAIYGSGFFTALNDGVTSAIFLITKREKYHY